MTDVIDRNVTETRPRRRGLGFGIPAGLLLAIVGFVIGHVLGTLVSRSWEPANGTDQQDLGLVLGYVFGVIGWLVGLGFARYPIRRIRGQQPGPTIAILAEYDALPEITANFDKAKQLVADAGSPTTPITIGVQGSSAVHEQTARTTPDIDAIP